MISGTPIGLSIVYESISELSCVKSFDICDELLEPVRFQLRGLLPYTQIEKISTANLDLLNAAETL